LQKINCGGRSQTVAAKELVLLHRDEDVKSVLILLNSDRATGRRPLLMVIDLTVGLGCSLLDELGD